MINGVSSMIKATVVTTAIAGLLMSGCNWDSRADLAPPYLHQVVTVAVETQPGYRVEREFAGEVQAGQNSVLGFEFPGQVAAVLVDVGDAVSTGQELARMDTSLLISERDQLSAQRSELEAEYETSRRNLERVRSLQAERMASEREFDELSGRVRVLEASLQRIDAALQANQVRLDKSVMRAPFPAVVAERLVDSGVVVAAGTPVVALVQNAVREVHSGVPADLAESLQAGDAVAVGNEVASSEGTVIGRGPLVDAATRSRIVRISVPGDWSPGTLAFVSLTVPVEKTGTWLPATAVTEGTRGTWVVYAAVDQGDGEAILEARSVVVHHARENELFVSGALSTDDRVVAAGLHRLAPGQRVRMGESPQIAAAN